MIRIRSIHVMVMLLAIMGCGEKRNQEQFRQELEAINLRRGEITLCGSEQAQLGTVNFGLSCVEKVRADFNLATALLHSFEYPEAEKVFAKVIDEDPDCVMAYWGVAMSNFHPLWAPPTPDELEKGSRTMQLARSLESKSQKESDYLEAVGVMYDDWKTLDHKTRLLKFEKAAEAIYQKYPDDQEAAVFYALALRAASDPTDKTFVKQKKAGQILNSLFPDRPDHPGIAHYLIHTYDYPELAELGLPAARKYASIAATSAHALHMPSHIFTRLGLWSESIQSNSNSMSAAKCYAESSGITGHWDEELHGLDYLVYAYLQQGRDEEAKTQLEYLQSMDMVSPVNNKDAYTFAAVPTRFALERKDWKNAATLQLLPSSFPWDNYAWERSLVSFGRALGAAHTGRRDVANTSLDELRQNHKALVDKKMNYEANQVQIQIRAAEAWIEFYLGDKKKALSLMTEAATMEDATEKHPVTPGEVVPARELLADMYFEMKAYVPALEAYKEDLRKHPQRFNGLYGAAAAARRLNNTAEAKKYFSQLAELSQLSTKKRAEVLEAEAFLK